MNGSLISTFNFWITSKIGSVQSFPSSVLHIFVPTLCCVEIYCKRLNRTSMSQKVTIILAKQKKHFFSHRKKNLILQNAEITFWYSIRTDDFFIVINSVLNFCFISNFVRYIYAVLFAELVTNRLNRFDRQPNMRTKCTKWVPFISTFTETCAKGNTYYKITRTRKKTSDYHKYLVRRWQQH